MRPLGFLLSAIALSSAAVPASAWNATGHRVVAAIAYDHLSPRARSRVDELIRNHPDYAAIFTQNAPAEPKERARAAFLAASVWPDQIRSDARFYDDTQASPVPTPILPGFPSMARHMNWHYIDIPYAPDGAVPEKIPVPNALIELRRILNGHLTEYDLPWLIHLEGDVHQPLHCAARFLKSQPKGDAGGNYVYVTPGRNLHAFWDDLAGTDASIAYVDKFAADITAGHEKLPSRRVSRNPRAWVDEGFAAATSQVYTFGLETGSRENPIALTPAYQLNALQVARTQLALAGVRLAAVLNSKL